MIKLNKDHPYWEVITQRFEEPLPNITMKTWFIQCSHCGRFLKKYIWLETEQSRTCHHLHCNNCGRKYIMKSTLQSIQERLSKLGLGRKEEQK